MPATLDTDIEQRCRNALTAICDGDATIQDLTRRSSRCLVPFRSSARVEKPALLLLFVGGSELGGAGDNRQLVYQVTAIAEGNQADAIANALIERVEQLVTEPALAAQGIDGIPWGRRRYQGPVDDVPGARDVGRADLELTLQVTK